ncbi:MAG: cupredoxin domain-containing protein [Armatimonadota bacterium]|nr:cupredoxin domain-containing protein [Armatimonadota bacterium]MDR7443875.1 cupredoxin domain-containing protein [Armatimonadota bacterium]MDR7571056.1 cupredoxin domain-containing protein [Armatimonadota bacterium]MDR7615483.1 cupredoxin domain-containing protein [Armatimonadota bacterium]
MKSRLVLLSLLAVVAAAVGLFAAPAPSRRVIRISMTSFRFDPNIIRLNEGERVVLQLVNEDPQRPHNIASAYFEQVELTVRGEFRRGTTSDGRPFIFLEPGKQAEVEFVVRGRGQYSFICSVGQHAAQGMTGAFAVLPPGASAGP